MVTALKSTATPVEMAEESLFSYRPTLTSQVPVRVTSARGFDDLRTRPPRQTVDDELIGIDTGLRQTAHVLVV